MTVYVDNVRIPASVGRYKDRRWCHLFSFDDDPTELHALAAGIGLRRSWFQNKDRYGRSPWLNHYDVTEAKRAAAIRAGAVEIDLREFSERVQRIRADQATYGEASDV